MSGIDGKYLASNIDHLKSIGDGKVFEVINNLLNTLENVVIAAYEINNLNEEIVYVKCLFKRDDSETLYLRIYNYFKSINSVDDWMLKTAEYGIGLAEYEVKDFLSLRDFYQANKVC